MHISACRREGNCWTRTDCGLGQRSAKYALRSYWYLLLHASAAAPAAALFGAARSKVLVFLATRVTLGAVSAFTEAMLYRCVCVGSSIPKGRLPTRQTLCGYNAARG